ncbi:MAG TPA: VTT domain-containing protein [Firmicutes bacterium]|nr:VTT domain-containing protein [Bacillota bacterium]
MKQRIRIIWTVPAVSEKTSIRLRLGLVLVVGAGLVFAISRLALFLSSPSVLACCKDAVNALGILGAPLIGMMLAIQELLAIFPSEPFEFVAGMCYGGFYGFLICLAGTLAGSAIVFHLVRRHSRAIPAIIQKKAAKTVCWLQKIQTLETAVFILYLVPALPKDLFTYLFAAMTPIRPRKFLALSGIARTASIITSTYIGANVGSGNAGNALLIFVCCMAGAVVIWFLFRSWMAKYRKTLE